MWILGAGKGGGRHRRAQPAATELLPSPVGKSVCMRSFSLQRIIMGKAFSAMHGNTCGALGAEGNRY